MYLDSCILVKLFVREADSEFFGKLTDGQVLSSSMLAYTEVWSALLAKERAGMITAEYRRRAWAAFQHNVDGETIALAPLSPALFRRAHRLLEQCHPQAPLRSLDALHLATCDQLQEWPFCTTDQRLLAAARLLGFPLATEG
jgi:predicted nucleic acid-binding protein